MSCHFNLIVKGEDMSYVALYRKWRPMVFDDVVGQDNIVTILKNQVSNQRTAHAYLFSGGRGTGKTSTAKILSRAVNCLQANQGNPCNQCEVCKGILAGNIMDVIEIDAASNNSVDDIRTMRDEVFYAPSAAKFRVYIIDEVHMLSTGAFNALLKILEEPPKHVIFILATTEPHKLPATILSRCQRFEFRLVGEKHIIARLKTISESTGVKIQQEALELIARMAEGALRDAISIFDQCMGTEGGTVTKQTVIDTVGIPGEETMIKLVDAISGGNILECMELVDRICKEGKDLGQSVSNLVRLFRDILVYSSTMSDGDFYLGSVETQTLQYLAPKFEQYELVSIIMSLSELVSNMKWSSQPRVMLEVEMVRLCKRSASMEFAALEDRISRVEQLISRKHLEPDAEIRKKPAAKVDTAKRPPAKTTEDKENAPKKKTVNSEEGFPEWKEVVSELKKSGKVVLYANLIGSNAVKLDRTTIGLVFGENAGDFGKTVVFKNENLTILKKAVKKVTGEDMNIKCVSEGEINKAPTCHGVDEDAQKVTRIAEKLDIQINIIDE